MNYNLLFWILNIGSTILRFLITDNFYCTTYTKFLYPPYFENYLIKSLTLFSAKNEIAIRFLIASIFFSTCWILFTCAKKLYNKKTAFITVLLLNILPVFSLLGFIINLINFHFIISWILALFVFTILIETNNKKYWYLLGIIIGLSTLFKNSAILIYFSVFMFIFLSPEHKFWLKKKEPYLALIISTLILLAIIIRNIGNDLIYFFEFQVSQTNFSLSFFRTSICTQIDCLSPLLFPIFTVAIFLCIKEAHQKKSKTALIIECFSLPFLLLFNILTAFNKILPEYLVIGYLVLSVYISHLTLKFWRAKWFRIYSYIAWGLSTFITITVLLHMSYMTPSIEKPLPQSQNNKYDVYQQQKDLISLETKSNLPICSAYFFPDNKEKYDSQILTLHTKNIVKLPNRNGKEIKNSFSTLCGSLTVLRQELIKLDQKAFKYVNSDLKCKFLDFYVSLISYCDSKKFNLSFIFILIISIGILWNNKREQFWIMVIVLAIILMVGTIITYALKYCFKSPRPLTVFGYENINIMFEIFPENSFPSGHTQIAFSICTFMFMTVKKYWYWYILLSLGVAFERVYSGNHFPLDALAGAVIGIFSTFIVINLFKKQLKYPPSKFK